MSRELLADLSSEVNSGIFLDPANDRVPLWADGKNIVFDPSGPRPVDGFTRLVLSRPAFTPVRGMEQAWINNEKYVFFGNSSQLFTYNVTQDVMTDVSKAGGYSGGEWSFSQWGNWMIASNDVDPVQIWKLSAPVFADLVHDLGGTFTATLVATFKAHAIFLGTDTEGREIKWSDEDDVNTLTPQIANSAGSLWVREMSSPVRGGILLRNGLVFFGDSTGHIFQWVDPPFYFGQFPLTKNAGILGKRAVAAQGNIIFGMGFEGIWTMIPGQEPEYIDRPACHNHIYDDLDFDNADKCVVWYDSKQQLMIFSYPSVEDGFGEPTRSMALSLRTGGWSPLDFAPTAAASTPAFEHTTAGDFRGGLYWHGVKGAGGGLPFDTQGFISFADGLTPENYYGLAGYGELGYGGP